MTASLRQGDALTVLRTLPDGTARCCVTSPPYWGLRDYGSCDCGSGRFNLGQGSGTGGNSDYRPSHGFDPNCAKCAGTGRVAGTDAQLGLERTPEEYVANMVAVFREVWRVLADDGTLWLNLGDSYAANWSSRRPEGGGGFKEDKGRERVKDPPPGLKSKDLVGIPWRMAFALQADGWYLRSDIIWAKPNPMPESVTDRPTKSHEYLFLLAKSERYYYNSEAVAEPLSTPPHAPGNLAGREGGHLRNDFGTDRMSAVWGKNGTRNTRTVWTIPTMPYKGAHFATFPEELARRCILAGSAPGDTVLDPFGGSGTVAQVATGNGRSAIHIDLNPAYIELARHRVGPMLCTEVA